MSKTLALIHTSAALPATFSKLANELLQGVQCFHMVDESLIRNTIAAGSLTPGTARRVLHLVESAQSGGADMVLVTCSSIGKAVEFARPFVDIPILRVDEPMAAAAVQTGSRIGVGATLRTTLEPTLRLLQDTAQRQQKVIETIPYLCEGAFDALLAGDTEEHDRRVIEGLNRLSSSSDVVVLAQASMARVLPQMPHNSTPIFSSPRLAIETVRDRLLGSF